jgi:hypothetical protein
MPDSVRDPATLVRAANRREHAFEQSFLDASFSLERLLTLQMKRLTTLLPYWRDRGCHNADLLSDATTADTLQAALSRIAPYQRVSARPLALPVNPRRSIRSVFTSGSSGFPLPYSLSSEWRAAHHVVWRLAYRHLSKGALRGYLDPAFTRAMARVPEGSTDYFPHQIECVPTLNGMVDSQPPKCSRPDVVHGSITTILEMLESEDVRRWKPSYIVITYEMAHEWQIQLLTHHWPAPVYLEYAANDGGAAAFSCSASQLHYWSQRSVPLFRNGPLRVVDLWNTATGFVGYECGDEVKWSKQHCSCGLALPILQVRGRISGTIQLDTGAVVSTFCPFSSAEMKGLSAVRVEVETGDVARLRIVRSGVGEPCLDALERRLLAMGFRAVRIDEARRMALVRSRRGKYQAVIDVRARAC